MYYITTRMKIKYNISFILNYDSILFFIILFDSVCFHLFSYFQYLHLLAKIFKRIFFSDYWQTSKRRRSSSNLESNSEQTEGNDSDSMNHPEEVE